MTFLGVLQVVSSVVVLSLCTLCLAGAYMLVTQEQCKLDKTDFGIIAVLAVCAVGSIVNLIV